MKIVTTRTNNVFHFLDDMELMIQESEYVKEEEELKEFIASSESESNEDENQEKRQKYSALIQSSDKEEEDKGMEMEVTFKTGLEYLSKKILEKKKKKSETVWEASLCKKKEKKKSMVEIGLFDKEGEASKEELELLVGDDYNNDGNVKGYNLKRKKSKGEKGKKEEKIPTFDYYDDLQFSSLFTRSDYALDPTDPQFKRSAVYVRQVAYKEHKKGQQHDEQFQGSEVEKNDLNKNKHEISMLLKSVKMKSKQLTGNKSRRKGK